VLFSFVTKKCWLQKMKTPHKEQVLLELKSAVENFVKYVESIDNGVPGLFGMYHYTILSCLFKAELTGFSRNCIELTAAVKPWYDIHGKHPFIYRLQTWPEGYVGDAKTIKMMLEPDFSPSNPRLQNETAAFFMNVPVVQQHRNKIVAQSKMIMDTMARKPTARILVVACGMAPDVIALSSIIKFFPEAQIILNDMDEKSLMGALKELKDQKNCSYFAGNIVSLMKNPEKIRDNLGQPVFGQFDLILAGGLFDYLNDKIATFLIKSFCTYLQDGGCFFFTNLDSDPVNRIYRAYACNWPLIERTEKDLITLTNFLQASTFDRKFDIDTSQQARFVSIFRHSTVQLMVSKL
jgi:extracellular factor (EF) 3-hydroxypalmitic acid methyl ester biosynthesis protein